MPQSHPGPGCLFPKPKPFTCQQAGSRVAPRTGGNGPGRPILPSPGLAGLGGGLDMAGAGLSTDGGAARRRSAACARARGERRPCDPPQSPGAAALALAAAGAGTKGGSRRVPPARAPGGARPISARRGTRPRPFPPRPVPGPEEPPRRRGRDRGARGCVGSGVSPAAVRALLLAVGWGVVCAGPPRLGGGRAPDSSVRGRRGRALRPSRAFCRKDVLLAPSRHG